MRTAIIKVWRFYVDGFRSMTLGRTLWAIILIKLFIMFVVLRTFFFPNFLNTRPEGMSKDEFVATELIKRSAINQQNR